MGDTFTEHDVKFCSAERRCYFILHHFHLSQFTENLFAIFDRLATTDIQTYRSVELQSVTTGCCFRVTEHNTDFLTQLVDENTSRTCLAHSSRQLTKSLRHQTCLKTYFVITHVAFDFRFRSQCSYRVNNDDVDSRRTNQLFRNLQRLLSVIRLRDIKIIDIYAQFRCVETVESMLGINESSNTAGLLCFSNGVDSQCCLTGRLRAIDFDDSTSRVTSNAKCHVQGNRACRDHFYLFNTIITHFHDRTFTEALFYLFHGSL